jgi:hypothetical protein
MNNKNTNNTTEDNNSLLERGDEARNERSECSCPQSSGSSRFISNHLAQVLTESRNNISTVIIGDQYRRRDGVPNRTSCDDETLDEIDKIMSLLRKYSIPNKFSIDQLTGYSE